MVAGAAGLLYAKLENNYAIPVADLPAWSKPYCSPPPPKTPCPDGTIYRPLRCNSIYGAGELNIHHAYSTLRTGKATASNSTQYKHRGWAAESVSSNSAKTYFFNIPAGAPSTPFCAALTWHRIVHKSGFNTWSNSLTNLSLRLHNASGFTVGSQITVSNSARGQRRADLSSQPCPPATTRCVVDNPPPAAPLPTPSPGTACPP